MGAAVATPEAWQSSSDDRAPIPGCTRVREVAGIRVYTIDGVDYLSTSSVLRLSPWGRLDHVPPAALEYGRVRGQYVDEACRMADDGTLDWEALDPKLRPYVGAWDRWKGEAGWVTEATEELVVYSDTRTFGYIDRRGTYGGKLAIIDIKTSVVITDKDHLQVASYLPLDGSLGLVVQLTKRGVAVEHHVDRAEHLSRFKALAAEAHRWIVQQETRG